MSGRKGHRRRRVIRRGAGAAFARFFIGVVLLAALCGAFYLFVLQGTVNVQLNLPEIDGQPTEEAQETPAPEITPTPTAVPTIVPTASPSATPMPAPTGTPIPSGELTEPADLTLNLPPQPSDSLKLGLKELSLFSDGGQNALVVRGYAYIAGRDAAGTSLYLLLIDPETGDMLGACPAMPSAEEADLSFDGNAGENLDQAFFRVSVNANPLREGRYLIAMAAENDTRVYWNYFDDSMYHFRVEQGEVKLAE